jgi:type IV secretion system protein VirB4
VQSTAIVAALAPYTLEGAYGRLLDGAAETLALADVVHFEMEALMQHKAVVPPVLTYLFHRLEAHFTGRPTLLILDEAWTFLDDPLFAAQIRAWLKTLRKKNVAVVFATQSLADIERSSIAPALIESCPTRIFLPNDRALEPQARAVYARFGLNDRQVEILATAAPKRDYYAQTARGNRLFELGLGPIALALCGAGSPDDQRLIDRTLSQAPADFAAAFLRAKGLAWAADLLGAFPATPATPPLTPAARTPVVAAPPPPVVNEPITPPPVHLRLGIDDLLPERLSPYRVSPKPNRAARRKASRNIATAVALSILAGLAQPRPATALTVFDPLNYQENVLSAVRAMEQINNQVRQLQNEAQALLRMDQNLQRLGTTISPDLQRSLADIQARLREGEGLALKLRDTEAGYAKIYPREAASALSTDDLLRNAKSRWDEEYASLKRSALLQGQIIDSIGSDSRLLYDALSRSRSASGALDVTQAGNELSALGVKQSLQLQSLLAAQARTETLNRARDLATEDEARQRFKSFVGSGQAYARSP